MDGIASLAPTPDFRYVGLSPRLPARTGGRALALGVATTVTFSVACGASPKHALLAGLTSSAAALVTGRACALPEASRPMRMAVVPWGVILGPDDAPRILRWAGIARVELVPRMPMAAVLGHGARLVASLGSLARAGPASCLVVIETARVRYVGQAPEHAPLERLAAHLDAYAREQSAPLGLGLDEAAPSVPAGEPFVEPLLGAVRSLLASGRALSELHLPPAGYRSTSTPSASPETTQVLERILGDRREHPVDRRAFAAVLAAELGAHAVVPALVALTQSPHPFVAAVARQAARALGVPRARAGALDEVAPFLWDTDRARLEGWLPEGVREEGAA